MLWFGHQPSASTMARVVRLFVVLLLLCPSSIFASYNEFFFATEETDWRCPGSVNECKLPQACVHEGLVNKYYCCGPGSDAVCWTDSTECAENTLECENGPDEYCCLDSREMCTQRSGEYNLCWATAVNPMAELTVPAVNETFSSLSSAEPSATTFSFDPVNLLPTATTSSISKPPATVGPTDTSPEPDSGLSGGAIGGIVVGVVVLLVAVGVGAFFFGRRKRPRSQGGGYAAVAGASEPPRRSYHAHPAAYNEAYKPQPQEELSPLEMDATVTLSPPEMEGSRPTSTHTRS